MNLVDFEALARRMYAEIPGEYLEGIDGLVVERAAVPHPTLPDVYTLGECRTESYPSEFGGAGIVRSAVVLYHGSFLALARLDEEFDWEGETWETLTHELQHHLESLASDETLEELDYAEDQNFARREGEAYEPWFYRSGTPLGPGAWEVDGDVFVEARVGWREIERGSAVVEWEGETYPLTLTEPVAGVELRPVAELEEGGELVAVVLRRRGVGEWLSALLGRWDGGGKS